MDTLELISNLPLIETRNFIKLQIFRIVGIFDDNDIRVEASQSKIDFSVLLSTHQTDYSPLCIYRFYW